MAIESVRIDEAGRDQLARLKRYTGIETWNVLCRWAFCLSLAERTPPPYRRFKGEPAIEIAWRVFAGPQHEVYLALLKARCRRDGLGIDEPTLHDQLRLHVHRGLGYLAANKSLRSIGALAQLGPEQNGSVSMVDRLAVYGALAPGGPDHHQLADLGGAWNQGEVRGHLIATGGDADPEYPGLILDPVGETVVVQVLESAMLSDHWARLDALESKGYLRTLATVITGDGDVEAWTYVLAR